MEYCGELTWKSVDPFLVGNDEREELERFKHMGMYEYVSRKEGRLDPQGKTVNRGTP